MTPLSPILCSNRCLPSGHRFRFSNRRHKLLTATTLNHFLTIIGLLAAVAGMICLFSGSFSENQFKDAAKLKVVVFTILPLLVLVFLWKARKCNEVVEKVCHKHVHIKTVVKIVFLGCATTVNLLIKFPRFNVRYSKDKKFSIGEQGRHSQGSRFNLYSAGSFSAFALVISSKREKAMELGIFDFLLGLTMDASMEIPGNDGVNLLYMLGAFVYCASLIFIRSYLESFMLSRDISGARQGNIQDLTMVLVEGDREDAAEETVNVVTNDPAAEDSEETIGLSHFTMPELMGLNISILHDLVRTEDAHLGLPYFLPPKYLNSSHLRGIDLRLSEFLHVFGDVVIDGVKLVSDLFFEDRQKKRVRTDVSEFETESERGEEQMWEIVEAFLDDEEEQRDEIDGAFLDVGSSEDAYLPDGLRKRRNHRGMKIEIRNVIPGIVKDRLPNSQVLQIREDCY